MNRVSLVATCMALLTCWSAQAAASPLLRLEVKSRVAEVIPGLHIPLSVCAVDELSRPQALIWSTVFGKLNMESRGLPIQLTPTLNQSMVTETLKSTPEAFIKDGQACVDVHYSLNPNLVAEPSGSIRVFALGPQLLTGVKIFKLNNFFGELTSGSVSTLPGIIFDKSDRDKFQTFPLVVPTKPPSIVNSAPSKYTLALQGSGHSVRANGKERQSIMVSIYRNDCTAQKLQLGKCVPAVFSRENTLMFNVNGHLIREYMGKDISNKELKLTSSSSSILNYEFMKGYPLTVESVERKVGMATATFIPNYTELRLKPSMSRALINVPVEISLQLMDGEKPVALDESSQVEYSVIGGPYHIEPKSPDNFSKGMTQFLVRMTPQRNSSYTLRSTLKFHDEILEKDQPVVAVLPWLALSVTILGGAIGGIVKRDFSWRRLLTGATLIRAFTGAIAGLVLVWGLLFLLFRTKGDLELLLDPVFTGVMALVGAVIGIAAIIKPLFARLGISL